MDEQLQFLNKAATRSKFARPSISIAMATYNGEKYIREQLESLAAQTVLPCELVVTDDGSSDRTIQIVQDFAGTVCFDVRIHRNQKRLGYAENFLLCASLCSGDLVAFCDQDDIWMPEKLETCRSEFDDEKVLLCVHSSTVLQSDGSIHRRWPDFKRRLEWRPSPSNLLSLMPGFSMVFRRFLIETLRSAQRPRHLHTLGGLDLPMTHDEFISFLASELGKIICLPDSLAFYRQHESNVCGVGPERSFWEKVRIVADFSGYYQLSRRSIECSQFLEVCSHDIQDCFNQAAKAAATRFRERARLQSIRASLYQDQVNFIRRLIYFAEILFSCGYFADRTGTRLGPRAALKDALLSLSGIYRVLNWEDDIRKESQHRVGQ